MTYETAFLFVADPKQENFSCLQKVVFPQLKLKEGYLGETFKLYPGWSRSVRLRHWFMGSF